MLRPSLLIVSFICVLTMGLSACDKGGKSAGMSEADKKAKAAAERPLQVTEEDLLTIRSNALASGPVITGSIQPERRADLRAEVSAIVLQVLKENGESVKKGDLLVRLDDTSIRDLMTSAEAASRAALQNFDQAERQFQRLKTLRTSGMASTQQLEDAEIRRNNAQSDLVAAKARTVQARQQLERTLVRAPFDGIVSERKVSNGDTAQTGKELVKVIDPTSMRFQGLVSADKINNVKPGQTVGFRINGYDQEFTGKVKRVDPAANVTTRQVEVMVEFADSANQPRVSGLYAEGRIEAGSTQSLTIANAALIRDGDKASAWRVKDGELKKVSVVIGERDPRRGDYALRSGLVDGDKIIANPMSTLKDGQKVQLVASAGTTAAAPAQPAIKAIVATEPAAGK
jgi:membrane fusion protein (multidrug efflux system)